MLDSELMKTLKASQEFKVGKNEIGWISDRLVRAFNGDTFVLLDQKPTVTTLERRMPDAEIEREIVRGRQVTLGDVLSLLRSSEKTYKDGYANLFYFPSFVVLVPWDGGGWYVSADGRGGHGWIQGYRVCCPATDSQSLDTVPADSLPLELIINGHIYRRQSE